MKSKIKVWLCRWALRRLRNLVDAADEWTHARELELRDAIAAPAVTAAAKPVLDPAYDRVASSQREHEHRKKARPARLRYVDGQFVRPEVSNV